MSTTQPPLPSTPHAFATQAVLEALAGDPDFGPTSAEVAARLANHGRNSLPERPGKPAWLHRGHTLKGHKEPAPTAPATVGNRITALLEKWLRRM